MSVMGEPNYGAWVAQRGAGFGGNLTIVDVVLPDMLHMVDAYWYQFPPITPLWHGILGFMMVVLGIISVVGNGMVIYIFCSTKSLRTPSNFLVVNLAFSDFCMMVTMAPPTILNCYYQTWVLGSLFCEIYGMFGSIFGCGSIWTMVFIAMDRYNVIVKGLSAKPLTKTTVLFWIFLIWGMASIWTAAPLFGWNRYVPEGSLTACGTDYLSGNTMDISYLIVYGSFCYVLPLLSISYFYFFIVRTVAAHEKSMRDQAKKMNVASLRSSENAAKSSEYKLAKIALMTITLWFMAWTPYMATNLAGILGSTKINPLSGIWCSILAKANAVYNPIVYAISHPRYRLALEKKFPSLVCGAVHDDTVSTATGVTNCIEDDKTTTI
ncbi:unnamed protein product [Phaedon cochleariae]|uniref:G-protein coupled receptors family 1 profile domain-containing protein n=1 Tax=Phaedon cochleariae TaxID=80249 RepID=A0A9P0GXA0_PHACE|nr:unnamed protein product [Phaedon cochleariae]